MAKQRKCLFKPGDVVQLRSDGPHMTVECFNDSGDPVCVWFDHHNVDSRYRHHEFLAVTLGLYVPANDGPKTACR